MGDIPHTFVPGEVASATEVNENFTAINSDIISTRRIALDNSNEIMLLRNNKANESGNSSVSFDVGPAKSFTNAVNKGELLNMLGGVLDYISGLYFEKDEQSGNNFIKVAKGSCYDTTHTVQIKLDLDQSFKNASQASNQRYYVFLSVDENGGNLQCLFNTSNSTTGLSVEYYRCIGYYETNNSNVISNTYSYGTNQSGMLDETSVNDMFSALYPNLSKPQSQFASAEWSGTQQQTTINDHYKLSSGKDWQVDVNGWVVWVCNEQDVTRDLKIGESVDNMITVARVRAAAGDDASGTAAFIPIRAGMYVRSSKSDIYFYPIRGV